MTTDLNNGVMREVKAFNAHSISGHTVMVCELSCGHKTVLRQDMAEGHPSAVRMEDLCREGFSAMCLKCRPPEVSLGRAKALRECMPGGLAEGGTMPDIAPFNKPTVPTPHCPKCGTEGRTQDMYAMVDDKPIPIWRCQECGHAWARERSLLF